MEAETRQFGAFLHEQRQGALHGELSEKLQELVRACLQHEKVGNLVLTIEVAPNEDGETVVVSDEIKVKVPEANRGAALFYADDRGNLSRRNPRQIEKSLRNPRQIEKSLREVGGFDQDEPSETSDAEEASQ